LTAFEPIESRGRFLVEKENSQPEEPMFGKARAHAVVKFSQQWLGKNAGLCACIPPAGVKINQCIQKFFTIVRRSRGLEEQPAASASRGFAGEPFVTWRMCRFVDRRIMLEAPMVSSSGCAQTIRIFADADPLRSVSRKALGVASRIATGFVQSPNAAESRAAESKSSDYGSPHHRAACPVRR
jgi:hypothetical protein